MRDYKLTKIALKSLSKISKQDNKLAKRIKKAILNLREEKIQGDSLQGHKNFRKIRIGKFRLIYTIQSDTLIVVIIEKRETIYQTFVHLMKRSDFL